MEQSISKLKPFLEAQGFGPEEILEINRAVTNWASENSKAFYFQITGTDAESGNSGYFISMVPSKVSKANAPKGYVFFID